MVKYAANEKFPKLYFPFVSYAKAMKADPNGGDTFRKKFTEEFAKDFKSKPESDRTMSAMYFFDPKIVKELAKQKDEFVEKLTLKKSDSISFKDAGSLLSFELAKQFTEKTLEIGQPIVKGYIPEYSQPFITGSLWASVTKPKEVNDFPDLTKDYKLLFELTDFNWKSDKETAYKNDNSFLVETTRILNLHGGSGIPTDRIKPVYFLHGYAMDILMNNDNYKKKYKADNPNLALIKQLQSKGAKFVVCGQSMTWQGWKLSDFTEDVKEAFSAKTALTSYQKQGYILHKIDAQRQ